MDNQVDGLALLLKSISHPIRLKILCLLQDKELTVSEIRAEVATSGAGKTTKKSKFILTFSVF